MNVRPLTALPFASFACAVNGAVSPSERNVTALGFSTTLTALCSTFSVAFAVTVRPACSADAVTVVVPFCFAWNTFGPVCAAIVASATPQLMGRSSTPARASSTRPVNVASAPRLTRVALAGVISICAAFAPTVTVTLSVAGPDCARITACPGSFVVTSPAPSTVATVLFRLSHVTVALAGPPAPAALGTVPTSKF